MTSKYGFEVVTDVNIPHSPLECGGVDCLDADIPKDSVKGVNKKGDLDSTNFCAASSLIKKVITMKHSNSGLTVVYCPINGPLCSVNIVVPTIPIDNSGLPHTLEHLVFCGSLEHPHRGFLDNLATRCLSNGTNAYTTEDHTSYSLTTASAEGMLNVLPVFVGHIFRPTLRNAQFVTEVFHIDGEAKPQGVVYCEMAGREETEYDIRDYELRRLLYGESSMYSQECGGRTAIIKNLTNDAIKKYHEYFYKFENSAVIITGTLDLEKLLESLNSVLSSSICEVNGITEDLSHNELDELLTKAASDDQISAEYVNTSLSALFKSGKLNLDYNKNFGPENVPTNNKKTVNFASSDEDVGSICFGWRGPNISDNETLLGLEIIFRFLVDTTASPIPQRFVECAEPLASMVDFDYRLFYESFFTLEFSGVSIDHEEMDDSISISSLLKLLLEVFENNEDDVMGLTLKGIHNTIFRQHRKIIEAFEEDPLEMANSLLITDFISNFYHSKCDNKSNSSLGNIGDRLDFAYILTKLLAHPLAWWKDLMQRFLIEPNIPFVELKMIPSLQLANDQVSAKDKEQHDRLNILGERGSSHAAKRAEWAINENKVDLPDALLSILPPIPDLSIMAKHSYTLSYWDLQDNIGNINTRPFDYCQSLRIDTSFLSVRFALDARSIPRHLAMYIPLLQELIFQTRMMVPSNKICDGIVNLNEMQYEEVSSKVSSIFTANEASLGLGNEIWSCSYLSEVFQILGSIMQSQDNSSKWLSTIRFLVQCLVWSEFDAERISTMAKNLLSEIIELKRGGYEMLSTVTTRITSKKESNDNTISIFTQESLLRSVIADCETNEGRNVIQHLTDLKSCLLKNSGEDHSGFIQLCVPNDFMLKTEECVSLIRDIWDVEISMFLSYQKESEKIEGKILKFHLDERALQILTKEKINDSSVNNTELTFDIMDLNHCKSTIKEMNLPVSSFYKHDKNNNPLFLENNGCKRFPFPFCRNPFSISNIDDSLEAYNSNVAKGSIFDVMVPIRGIGASFLNQLVACDVLSNPKEHYFWSVRILAELLSVTEGPLYTRIRGKGFAYGATLSLIVWGGQLSFELYECSDIASAMNEFYTILQEMKDFETFKNEFCNPTNLETAKASLIYQVVSNRSTASGVRSILMHNALGGCLTPEAEIESLQLIYKVDLASLWNSFNKFFLKFLGHERVTVCIVPKDASGEDSDDDEDVDDGYVEDEDVDEGNLEDGDDDDDDESESSNDVDGEQNHPVTGCITDLPALSLSQSISSLDTEGSQRLDWLLNIKVMSLNDFDIV